MNITRLNFKQTLPLVKAAIKDSHFLSFDLQMSGILTEELTTPSIVDSMQIRYEKQKQCINKYIPLQFGLSTFRVLPEQNKIIASPFNFYIFPLTHNNQVMKFSFHAGTMNFLTKNNFDFNKLFYEGIPYTNKEKLQLFKKQQNINDLKRQLNRLKQMQSPETKVFIALNLPLVEEWMKSEQISLQISIKLIKFQAYMNLKQQIEQIHPLQPLVFQFDSDLIYKRTKMIIKKISQEEKTARTQQIDCHIQEEVLFNEVVDEMCDSKKPLIVHNGFLDLMHVYYRFYNYLPNEWQDYKKELRNLFPRIYDNKYLFNYSPTLMSLTPSKFTSLGDCFTGMKAIQISQANTKLPMVEIDPNFTEYNLDNLECHEAGFDSLMTGYSFLKGVTTLNNDISLLTSPIQFAEANRLIVNRIPQGSIKIPFNLQDKDEDIYIQGGNNPIFFKSVLCRQIKETVVQDYFSKNFGPINFLWANRDMTEFCIIFLDNKDEQTYQQHLEKTKNGTTSIIVQIQNVNYLVLNSQEHRQLINNFIKCQLPQSVPTNSS